MSRNATAAILFACALAAPSLAQTTTRRTTTTTTTATPSTTTPPAAQDTTATEATTTTTSTTRTNRARRTQAATSATGTGATAVRAAFDRLLDGIRASDVDQVMGVYAASPNLVVFNNNGTITRGADNYRSTREQIYSKVSGVTLDVRDVRVQMLGRDGAVVTSRWTQDQTAGGASESATGRMTVVFERTGGVWRAVHTHTSPDAPDPSRILPSERTTTTPTPTETVPGARTPATTTTPTTRPATRP